MTCRCPQCQGEVPDDPVLLCEYCGNKIDDTERMVKFHSCDWHWCCYNDYRDDIRYSERKNRLINQVWRY